MWDFQVLQKFSTEALIKELQKRKDVVKYFFVEPYDSYDLVIRKQNETEWKESGLVGEGPAVVLITID